MCPYHVLESPQKTKLGFRESWDSWHGCMSWSIVSTVFFLVDLNDFIMSPCPSCNTCVLSYILAFMHACVEWLCHFREIVFCYKQMIMYRTYLSQLQNFFSQLACTRHSQLKDNMLSFLLEVAPPGSSQAGPGGFSSGRSTAAGY